MPLRTSVMGDRDTKLAMFADDIAQLIAARNSDAFPQALVQWLYSVATCGQLTDPAAWVTYNRRGFPPQIQFQTLVDSASSIDRERLRVHETYMRSYYLLDPTYLACVNSKKSGLFSIEELAPDEFVHTEYYQKYYIKDGLTDELNFLFSISDDSALNISLVIRPPNDGRFCTEGRNRLKYLEPLVRELAYLHWPRDVLENKTEQSGDRNFHAQFERGYRSFGKSCLTEREREVVHLMLQGHSRNSASIVMDVSPSTVKEHRKNIYRKLDVSSHAELFALFFEALKYSDGEGEDPLANYLAR